MMPENRSPLAVLAALLALLSTAPAGLRAEENPYDAVAVTIAPFIDMFLSEPRFGNRAVQTDIVVGPISGAGVVAGAAAGSELHLALEVPDKLLLRGKALGREVVLCRRGQRVWGWPRAGIESLLGLAGNGGGAGGAIPDFRLPVNEQQAAFAPALLKVQDRGYEETSGVNCRVLQIELIPELENSLDLGSWTLLAWIKPQDHGPRKLRLAGAKWQGEIIVRDLRFSRGLDPATWAPPAEIAPDVVEIPPAQFTRLLGKLLGGR